MADRPRSGAPAHVVYGLHAVEAVLDRRIGAVRSATVLAGNPGARLASIVDRLEAARIPVERVRRNVLDGLVDGGVHQGVAVRVPAPSERDLGFLEELVDSHGANVRLLLLDQVEDPRNLGACLRTADAAGFDAIVVPKARSAKLSPAALKVAAGAAETVPLAVVPNLARVMRWLADAGVRLVGADSDGAADAVLDHHPDDNSDRNAASDSRGHSAGQGGLSPFDANLSAPVAIVLGAEGRGLRRLTREACDVIVRIPMLGTVESLNVSVAAGILLYEVLRQNQ